MSRILYARTLEDDEHATAMVVEIHGRLYGGVCWLQSLQFEFGSHPSRIDSVMRHTWGWMREIVFWEDFVRDAEARQWREPPALSAPVLAIGPPR